MSNQRACYDSFTLFLWLSNTPVPIKIHTNTEKKTEKNNPEWEENPKQLQSVKNLRFHDSCLTFSFIFMNNMHNTILLKIHNLIKISQLVLIINILTIANNMLIIKITINKLKQGNGGSKFILFPNIFLATTGQIIQGSNH